MSLSRSALIISAISLFSLSVLLACSEPTPQSEIVVYDGVEVRLNYRPVFESNPDEIIPAEDVLVIDEAESGMPEGEFIVDVNDLMAGSNGEFVVLESDICRIFVFDSEGKYLRSFGRAGSGPGELTRPYTLPCLDRDLVAVTESGRGEVNIFDLQGLFIRRVSFPVSSFRTVAPDADGGFFLSDRAVRRPGESGGVTGTILYRFDHEGRQIPFNLSTGNQDTLEIVRHKRTGDEKVVHRITNRRNVLNTPDGSVLVAGFDYTFYRATKEGRMAGFRRVGDPFYYPKWYLDYDKKLWDERGMGAERPIMLGNFIEPSQMTVDERGHLWVRPDDGLFMSRATSVDDIGRDGVFALDEFSPDGYWLRHLLIQLPEPFYGIVLMDAAHGCLYGTTAMGDRDDYVSRPIRFKRP